MQAKQVSYFEQSPSIQEESQYKAQIICQDKKKIANKTLTHSKKWTIEENQAYVCFLRMHSDQLGQEKLRRQLKTFKKMSDLMEGRRSSEQCRGHHKKMTEKHKTVQCIIEAIEERNKVLRRNKENRESKRRNNTKKILSEEGNSSTDDAQVQESSFKEYSLKKEQSLIYDHSSSKQFPFLEEEDSKEEGWQKWLSF